MSSMRSLTRDQAREIDRIAINEYGVRGIVLMENAGRACAEEALKMLGETVFNVGEYWMLALGLVFIIVVMALPEGVVGTWQRWYKQRSAK